MMEIDWNDSQPKSPYGFWDNLIFVLQMIYNTGLFVIVGSLISLIFHNNFDRTLRYTYFLAVIIGLSGTIIILGLWYKKRNVMHLVYRRIPRDIGTIRFYFGSAYTLILTYITAVVLMMLPPFFDEFYVLVV